MRAIIVKKESNEESEVASSAGNFLVFRARTWLELCSNYPRPSWQSSVLFPL